MRHPRQLGILTVAALTTTVVWLALLLTSGIATPPPETLEEALASVHMLDATFYLTYVNAVLVTLTTTALFSGLYVNCRRRHPMAAMLGFVFVPAYTVLALIAYTSPLTIVPRLAALQQPAYEPAVSLLLAQFVQSWTGSVISVINTLAYAILGIPSIIFGIIFIRWQQDLRLAGSLLAFSGAASIVGIIGIGMQIEILSVGSLAGSALYVAALVPLAYVLLRR